ncbi:hypothetical protein C4M95_04075, partial [Mycoplasmopsis pullorum]
QQEYSADNFGKLNTSLVTRINNLLNVSNISFSNHVYNTTVLHKTILRIDKVFEHLRQINEIYKEQIKDKKIHFYLDYYRPHQNKHRQYDYTKFISLTIHVENSGLPKISSFKEAEQLFKELDLSHMEYDTKTENDTLYEQPYEMLIFTFNNPNEYKNALEELNSLFANSGITKKVPFRFKIWSEKLDFQSEQSDSITDTLKMSWYDAKWSIGVNARFLKDIPLSNWLLVFPFEKCPHIDEFIQTNFIWLYHDETFLTDLYKKSIYSSDVDYWAWPKSWW